MREAFVIQYFCVFTLIYSVESNIFLNPYELQRLYGRFLQICYDFNDLNIDNSSLDILQIK